MYIDYRATTLATNKSVLWIHSLLKELEPSPTNPIKAVVLTKMIKAAHPGAIVRQNGSHVGVMISDTCKWAERLTNIKYDSPYISVSPNGEVNINVPKLIKTTNLRTTLHTRALNKLDHSEVRALIEYLVTTDLYLREGVYGDESITEMYVYRRTLAGLQDSRECRNNIPTRLTCNLIEICVFNARHCGIYTPSDQLALLVIDNVSSRMPTKRDLFDVNKHYVGLWVYLLKMYLTHTK